VDNAEICREGGFQTKKKAPKGLPPSSKTFALPLCFRSSDKHNGRGGACGELTHKAPPGFSPTLKDENDMTLLGKEGDSDDQRGPLLHPGPGPKMTILQRRSGDWKLTGDVKTKPCSVTQNTLPRYLVKEIPPKEDGDSLSSSLSTDPRAVKLGGDPKVTN